jgi:hypothetical protein
MVITMQWPLHQVKIKTVDRCSADTCSATTPVWVVALLQYVTGVSPLYLIRSFVNLER